MESPGTPPNKKKVGKGWWIFLAIVAILLLIGLANRDTSGALCRDGEQGKSDISCNSFDRPCPSGVSGCDNGCTHYVCYDRAGNPTRQGWVKN